MKCVVFGLLLALFGAVGTAQASTVNCVTNPALCNSIELSGGAYVKFTDNLFTRFMDLTPDPVTGLPKPYQVEADVHVPGSFHDFGSGSLATGELKLFAQSLSTFQTGTGASVTAQDVFTLLGPGTTPVPITAVFRADGTADLVVSPNPGGLQNGGSAGLVMCGPGGSFACGGDGFSRGGFPPSFVAYSGAITSDAAPSQAYLERVYSFSVVPGTPFTMFYQLNASAYNGSTIDMSHTGSLSFTLPAGYRLESVGGWGTTTSTVPAAVPEPSTWTLIGLGLLGAAHRIRRRI